MNLRGWGFRIRGNVVGREGLEPSTKRLRVSRFNGKYQQKTRISPLSGRPVFMRKSPSRPVDLRDGKPIGRHGSLTIVEVRDVRGRRSIRYVR